MTLANYGEQVLLVIQGLSEAIPGRDRLRLVRRTTHESGIKIGGSETAQFNDMRAKALVWLAVAAARAWDFPWSSTEEGWAPAEDAPRPEEDPFWVAREPCDLARRGPRRLRLALREEPLPHHQSRRGDVAPLPNGGRPLRPAQRPRDNEVLV